MATSEQVKALIRSHYNDNSEQFFSTVLQIAAHEARQGHSEVAHEIRDIVDKAKKEPSRKNILVIPQNLNGLIFTEQPELPISSLIVNEQLKKRIERIITEFRQQNKLKSHGLSHRRKILLAGPPGTGKTMTAKVLASELKQLLHIIQMDRLVTKFMGETGAKLRQIFDKMSEMPGVYLFDEFDAIGGERKLENDVGEMRRVLNAFLQFIEKDTSNNLIIAATNNLELLDRALFRRFDDVLHYDLPEQDDRKRLINNLLGVFRSENFPFEKASEISEGLSHAEIDHVCRDAIKLTILNNKNLVTFKLFEDLLKERRSAYHIKGR
ncbi:ATP-binding protein [Candidatus Desantisbacteria bacterium]|nr:ATP-binding protein [Candidatus Desantisbacteria bacterium]